MEEELTQNLLIKKLQEDTSEDEYYTEILGECINSMVFHKYFLQIPKEKIENAIIYSSCITEETKDTIDKLLNHDNKITENKQAAAIINREKHSDIRKKKKENLKKEIEAVSNIIGKGDINRLKQIINKNPSLMEEKNKKGFTPLVYSISIRQNEAAEFLANKSDKNIISIQCNNRLAIHYAAENNMLKVIRILIEKGADPNEPQFNGKTPLFIAAENGCSDLIDFFVEEHEADINAKTKNGNTALHAAAKTGKYACVEKLLRFNADVNAQNAQGKIPLHYASNHKTPSVANALLKKEPSTVNTQDNEGNTPLMQSIMIENKKLVEAMLSYRACDFSLKNKEGKTVFDIKTKDEGIRALLKEYETETKNEE